MNNRSFLSSAQNKRGVNAVRESVIARSMSVEAIGSSSQPKAHKRIAFYLLLRLSRSPRPIKGLAMTCEGVLMSLRRSLVAIVIKTRQSKKHSRSLIKMLMLIPLPSSKVY